MDLSSPSYRKAAALLHQVVDEAKMPLSTGALLTSVDFGNHSPCILSLRWLIISLFIFPAHLLDTFNETERKAVIRAKEVVTNKIMTEVQYEDPKAQESFEAAVRHQIVMVCHNLRISLCLVEHLMALYNDAVTAGKISPGRPY